jgi:signal peptidase II
MQAESGSETMAARDAGPPSPPVRRAPRLLTTRQAVLLVLALVLTILVADQLTKSWITERYGPCGNLTFTPVIGHVAGFSYVCNSGTAFSRFQDTPLVWVPVLIAICAVAWLWLRSLKEAQLLQQIAFGMIIGGAIGNNVIDRGRLGYVVDFIDLRLNDHLRFYVFNVADSCISIGVVLLAIAFWRAEAARPRIVDPEATGD